MAETNMTQSLKVLAKTGKIYLADRGEIDAATEWLESFMTTEGSLNITQSQGDTTDIKVDQQTAPVSSIIGTGTFDITFEIPSMDATVLALFFNTATPTYSPTGYSSISVGTTLKTLNKMMKIKYTNVDSEIIFTNVDLTGVITKAADGAVTISVTGKVLAAGGVGYEDKEIIVRHKS